MTDCEQQVLQANRKAEERTGYKGILLVREGDWAVVKVECPDGKEIEVIRALLDDQFYHWVGPLGIEEAMFPSADKPKII